MLTPITQEDLTATGYPVLFAYQFNIAIVVLQIIKFRGVRVAISSDGMWAFAIIGKRSLSSIEEWIQWAKNLQEQTYYYDLAAFPPHEKGYTALYTGPLDTEKLESLFSSKWGWTVLKGKAPFADLV